MKTLFKILACSLLLNTAIACTAVRPPVLDPSHDTEWRATCEAIWQQELGRPIDAPALADCLIQTQAGSHEPEIRARVHDSEEAVAYRHSLEKPPVPVLPNGGQSGVLTRTGLNLFNNGAHWRYAGQTAFALYYEFVKGTDINPIITDYLTCGGFCKAGEGPNTLRVLMTANALFDLPLSATTPETLNAFLAVTDARGVRVEFVVFADANPDLSAYPWVHPVAPEFSQQLAFLNLVAPVLDQHPLVIGELCNECSHRISRVDRKPFAKPYAENILWERGSGQADEAPFTPPWDLVGDHSGRQDDWPRRLPARDIRMAVDGGPWQLNVPAIENEPMGAADADQPGRRTSNADDLRQFAAHCGMNANGCLYHPDNALLAHLLGDIQGRLSAAFFQGLNFAPPESIDWPYRRGGLSGQLAACLVHSDASTLRTFSKEGPDGTCYSVAIRTTVDPVAADGRAIVSVPARGLVITK